MVSPEGSPHHQAHTWSLAREACRSSLCLENRYPLCLGKARFNLWEAKFCSLHLMIFNGPCPISEHILLK